MSIAIAISNRSAKTLINALKTQLPNVEVRNWHEYEAGADVKFAVCWQQPSELWSHLPHLQVVSSLGAGVDGLVYDMNRPSVLNITRIVDPSLSAQMADYVLATILNHQRNMQTYWRAQQEGQWIFKRRNVGNHVTILGAGEIGLAVARKLHLNGYQVSTWSQSLKEADYICTSYVGMEQLIDSVKNADVVISVLPATTQTNDVIGEALFTAMPEQGYFINVGRGNTVDEQALINALNSADIAGAALDVFKQEPLPEHHPFWQLPQLTITPHISAITDQGEVVQQIAENYRRFTLGKALNNQVDVNRGY
ncbi:glyoxylate/hydroxypyruvate reductase A [Thalassotalea euphylliae]|uniref:Glyoxylate/hydroxypyruvate reductase A n=1 Tax=Thalassotalea euphylliae TaxID=1655234 RepID=A0A3E0TTU7_9GAMM|nr:glyoxylate/hydroxypyruvate reductase A [Thalassotalea euphylliae]REL27854.1 glyoxylate/hydroxypyruvate reductase A [Thalassotalea euphylliae]